MKYALGNARVEDVVFWQETKLQADKLAELRSRWRHHEGVFMSSAPQGSRRGVITLFSPRIQADHLDARIDDMGQFIINIARINNFVLMFINLYGDPDTDANSLSTLTRLEHEIANLQQRHNIGGTIMGGDFNMVLNDSDTTSSSRKPRAEAKLASILEDLDIYDVGLNAVCSPRAANQPWTYFKRRDEVNVRARYDRFYASPHLIRGATFDVLHDARVDDHSPIRFEFWRVERDDKQWIFDDKLINSPEFVQKMQDRIRTSLQHFCSLDTSNEHINRIQYRVEEEHDRFTVIDHVISEVRELAMAEMEVRDREANRRTREALEELVRTRRLYNEDPNPTDEQTEAMEEAQLKFRDVLMHKGRRQAEASKIRYSQQGERVTGYHFGIMSRGKPGREIVKLTEQETGAEIRQPDIPNHMAAKYREITAKDYTVGAVTIRQFLGEELADRVKKCPQDMEDILTSPITVSELEEIVKDLKANSAPGPKGISNRLLKELFPAIGKLLAEAGNAWLLDDNEKPPPAWVTTRKVVFIPKPNKRRDHEDSYRGLSMLENVYKLFSKAVAKRLAPALYAVQDDQQFGFTTGRGCMEASRTVIDAVKAATEEGVPMIVMNTDMYKAFDTIDKDHILNCLDFFEFPPAFRRAVERLMRTAVAVYEVNGKLSDEVLVERGTGQGDPISSFAFNLSVTPLNLALAELSSIPRVRVRGMEVPPVFFADDMSVLLLGHLLAAILATIQKIKDYRKVSGLTLNPAKCEILPINCTDEVIDPLIQQSGMQLVQETKHLGLRINNRGLLTKESNVQPIIDKMNKIATQYSTCLSTPLGRALYARFLLGSRSVHLTMNRHMSEDEALEFRESVLQMTWTKSGNRDEGGAHYRVHISKKIVAQSRYYGGLNVPDPMVQNTALRLAWARKFMQDDHMTWYLLLNQLLVDARRPSPRDHLMLGHMEWITSGDKIMAKNSYWGSVLREIGEIAKAATEVNKDWQLIPLIGSDEANQETTIGSLSYANPNTRAMINNGLTNIGHLFRTNEVGHILQNSIKPLVELNMQYNNCVTLPLMNSIAALVQAVKRKYRLRIISHTVPPEDSSPLLRLIQKHPRGCSAATEVMLAKQRSSWTWGDRPKAHRSYTEDGLTGVSEREYSMAFVNVGSRDVPPSAQWTSTQVLTRTLWTKVKESNTARGIEAGVDGTCMNCHNDVENTRHMMYYCPTARQIWDKVFSAISGAGLAATSGDPRQPYPLRHDVYAVLFLKIPLGIDATQRRDIYDIITITKHVLYKVRFRDDPDRIPSARRLTILTIEELELTAQLKLMNLSKTRIFNDVIVNLRDTIGWN